ncbi:hypothetical protein HWV62_3 [Athelia sp. TMB]|nr:hypothetical protein HWV62_3 [Athelia sp. TMB]
MKANYFRQYRTYNKMLEPKNSSKCSITHQKQFRSVTEAGSWSAVQYKESTIGLGPAKIRFQRTLRVPDNAKTYLLPPGLGTFPLLSAASFTKTVPEYIAKRGGLLMPIFQREAMWIDFSGSGRCAIKISIGGVNAITGRPRDEDTPISVSTPQDYVVGGLQPWLDGICTASGEVRQFVAMPLGRGYTVEEQITSEAKHGGIQVDVYPLLEDSVAFFGESGTKSKRRQLDLLKTPNQLQLAEGNCVHMKLRFGRAATPTTLGEYARQVGAQGISLRVAFQLNARFTQLHYTAVPECIIKTPNMKYLRIPPVEGGCAVDRIKSIVQGMTGIPPDLQALEWAGTRLKDGKTLQDYDIPRGSVLNLRHIIRGGGYHNLEDARMGMAAGGRIQQKIYEDVMSADSYDMEAAERLHVHTLSTKAWEKITGVVPPITPIVPSTYQKYNYPWFSLYDEHVQGVTSTGHFNKIKSLGTLDKTKHRHLKEKRGELLDPEAPPNCSTHRDSIAACVARPCNHYLCVTCIGQALMSGMKCGVSGCDKGIEATVGFKTPVAKLSPGGGSDGDWWETEQLIDGVSLEDRYEAPTNVVSLILAEDGVSPLLGKR